MQMSLKQLCLWSVSNVAVLSLYSEDNLIKRLKINLIALALDIFRLIW